MGSCCKETFDSPWEEARMLLSHFFYHYHCLFTASIGKRVKKFFTNTEKNSKNFLVKKIIILFLENCWVWKVVYGNWFNWESSYWHYSRFWVLTSLFLFCVANSIKHFHFSQGLCFLIGTVLTLGWLVLRVAWAWEGPALRMLSQAVPGPHFPSLSPSVPTTPLLL